MAHKISAFTAVVAFIVLAHPIGRALAQEQGSSNQTQEEQQVGIWYGIGQSFQGELMECTMEIPGYRRCCRRAAAHRTANSLLPHTWLGLACQQKPASAQAGQGQ